MSEPLDDRELAAIRRWMAGEQPQELGDRHMDVSWIAHRLLAEVGRLRETLAQVVDLVANSADHDDIAEVLDGQAYTYEWAIAVFGGDEAASGHTSWRSIRDTRMGSPEAQDALARTQAERSRLDDDDLDPLCDVVAGHVRFDVEKDGPLLWALIEDWRRLRRQLEGDGDDVTEWDPFAHIGVWHTSLVVPVAEDNHTVRPLTRSELSEVADIVLRDRNGEGGEQEHP